MHTDHEIRKKIMRRVYLTYFVRHATSPALRAGLLGGSLFILTQVVSVKDIFLNALGTSGFDGLTRFLYSAFVSTEVPVLAITLLATALVLWFIVDQVLALTTPSELQPV